MGFIDFAEWRPDSNDKFAYRFPHSNLSTYTQLVVHESQEAVLFSKGQILGKFGPGKHTLNTENLPLLRSLYGIPFGGKNPFTAEVWFVNKAVPLTIDWRTSTMRFMDPEYNQMIPLFAAGRYGLKVTDAERFLIKLVGTIDSFTAKELTDHFMGELVSRTKSTITTYMNANGVGLNYISCHLDELSSFMTQPLAEFWDNYGFHLEGFYITTVDLDTSIDEGRKIAQALSDRSAQGIAGYTWQQKQTFNVANNATQNGGGMSGLLAAAMLGGGFGGSIGAGSMVMQPAFGQGVVRQSAETYQTRQVKRKEVFCAKCGKKRNIEMSFCPGCGKKYFPCPTCGSDNLEDSKRCVKCGSVLQSEESQGNSCGRCGMSVEPGMKFCPGCGNPIG